MAEALDGRFEPHHGELAWIILDQIDQLTAQIDALSDRVSELIAAIPAAQGVNADGTTGPLAGTGPGAPVLPAVARLDEITGCGVIAAQAVIAEIGLDMTVFGTPGRLVSWAKRCPQTRQSGNKATTGKVGKGNPWLNGILGEIAASASRTDTFLGERCRRKLILAWGWSPAMPGRSCSRRLPERQIAMTRASCLPGTGAGRASRAVARSTRSRALRNAPVSAAHCHTRHFAISRH